MFNTYEEWESYFDGAISEKTIIRAIKLLVEKNLLICGNYNHRKGDKTIWYTPNYDEIHRLWENVSFISPPAPHGQRLWSEWGDTTTQIGEMVHPIMGNCSTQNDQSVTIELRHRAPAENSPDVIGLYGAVTSTAHSENTISEKNMVDSAYNPLLLRESIRNICKTNDMVNECKLCEDVILYFIDEYRRIFQHEHPHMTKASIENVVLRIASGMIDDHDFTIAEIHTFDEWKMMIDKYLVTDWPDCDCSISHFLSEGILLRRFYEILY